ncbi:MAG TPA: PAS domain S-box protein [Nitrospiraceae bacterium]|nr:PAS domain S-box protein [Nitrospiraceae bacterium]
MSPDTIRSSTGSPTQGLQTQHSAAGAPTSASSDGPISILIVDDEPKNLTVLETVLNDPGYRLVRAESGEQALLALVDDEFALLILDIQMPGMTGFELAHIIKGRKKTAGVPIIFLTAYYNEDQHVLEGYGTGAVDYLHKPVNPTILRSKVAIFAELHRKNRECGIANRALVVEVTERRRAEEQLRELNDTLERRVAERTEALMKTSVALNEAGERYRSLFDDSLDAIFSLSADERFEAANPAALRLTARTFEELKTIRFLDLCAPDQRETAANAFRTVFRCENLTMDMTIITATGERRDLIISATPAIVNGKVVGVSCIARDVTERKQAQEAVQQSEARLSGIISSAMDAIITIDQTECVIDFNHAAEQMFECTAANAVGRQIDRFIPKRSWAMHGRHIDESGLMQVTNPLVGALGTIYGHRANGEEFPIEAAISQLETQAGKFYTLILRDMTERVRQETALRLSEARYRDLIQALPAAVYTCDEQGHVMLYNQSAVALLGREPEVGEYQWSASSWKVYRPDGSPLPLDQLPMEVTLHEGHSIRGEEIVIERPDGTRRYVLPHSEPMLNADGAVVGAVNMLVDITDRKQAEQAVANLAAIVTSSDDAIIGMDLCGNVTSWNRGAERLYGYTAEDMIGNPITSLIPADRQDEESHMLERVRCGESVEHYETIRRCKDGSRLIVSLTVSPVSDSHGRIIGASKIARNITEQKRIEQALRRSERDLSDFFDNASIGLHWVGPDGMIIKVNQTELDLFGYSREEYMGRHIAEFHVDKPAIQDILDRLARGETLSEYPARIQCKDGSIRDVLVNSNVLFDDGRFIHTRDFTRDVTDRNRAEKALVERDRALTVANEALKKQTAALARVNKELEGFSYSVSHDLRAPLRTIDAFSRIIEEDHGSHLNPEAHRCLTIVRKAAGQAGELIDDLLEFSRLGRQEVSFRFIEMTDLVREVADDMSIVKDGRKIDLTIGALPSCEGDRRLLKLVWNNLLSNAFKYTKNQSTPRIEVGWVPGDSSAEAVTYYIKDNGVGFDMQYVHKLFGVFQRLHRKEDFEGTGVGLANVRRIIQRHGGRVWAEGKVDGGATFYFSLRKATV